jgi:hypothetical protein
VAVEPLESENKLKKSNISENWYESNNWLSVMNSFHFNFMFYFYNVLKQQEQIKNLKGHLEEEVSHHEAEIKRHQQRIKQLEEKAKTLDSK